MLTYEQLETRLAQWAATEASVRAVIAVGSRARGDADRWSDLDVLLLTSARERFTASPAWLGMFGDLWLTYLEATDLGDAEWYAVYAGGLKLDITLLDVRAEALDLEALLALYPYQGAFGRGTRVLYDRHGAPRQLPPKAPRLVVPPSAAEFDHAVSGLLLAALTTAKFVARGDYYRAQHWFARDLHVHLLTLTEWQAQGRDTWYSGRFMTQWADPRVLAALPATFPLLERASLSRALGAILDLARWLGEDVAARCGCAYPAPTHARIAAQVAQILAETQA